MTDPSSRPLRVFLCHSSGDKPIVRELYQKLAAEGWIDVWLDEEKLYPGQDWNYEIEKAVEAADVIIVCLSTNSVTKEGYVQRELKYALDIALEKPEGTIFVIPLRLDNCEPPRRLRGWQYADYFPESLRARAYQRMLESLKVRARYLNLPIPAPEKIPTPDQVSPLLSTPQPLASVPAHPSVGPKPTPSIAHLRPAIKRIPIWKYGRILVIFLLISGVFGPWFEITSCSAPTPQGSPSEPTSSIVIGYQEYFQLISSKNIGVITPLLVASLFLLTLVRLIPGRFRDREAVVRSERLAAALTVIAMSAEKFFATFTIFGSTKLLWGFWLSIVSVYLAPINLLFEKRFTMQKGQKWPRWAWLLGISIIIAIILPWLFLLLLWLLSVRNG